MWKKIEKATTMCIAALLVVIATVSGTMAYESIVEQEIFTAQNDHRIDVQLLRQRTNADGEYVDITEDPMLVPLATGYTENIIRVKNSGNIDTFNRVIIAVPANLDESMELVKGNGWTLTETIMGQSCEDETCNIYIFTMDGSLEAETISDPAILGVRVDAALEQHRDTYILNDVIYDYSEGLQLKTVAQAIQSAFFESPENAFEKGGMADNPWAPSITLNSPVSDTALKAVLRTIPTGTDITKSVTNVIFGKQADYGHIMESCYGQPVDDADPNGPWAYYEATTDGEGNTTWTIYILSDGVIYLPENCDNLFLGMSALTAVDTAICDTRFVTSMHGMFQGCGNLTYVDVSDWDMSKVTSISQMFYQCSKIDNLDVSQWDTSGVTAMDNAFNGCSSVTELDVSNWDTSKVTTTWQMFQNCSKLTSLNLTGWNTTKVQNTANMFFNCRGLTELDISSFDVKGVNRATNMFNGCSNLTTIYVSADAGWDALASSHAEEVMFASSTKLIGGEGTHYIDQYGIYARIDSGTSAPGYFTQK